MITQKKKRHYYYIPLKPVWAGLGWLAVCWSDWEAGSPCSKTLHTHTRVQREKIQMTPFSTPRCRSHDGGVLHPGVCVSLSLSSLCQEHTHTHTPVGCAYWCCRCRCLRPDSTRQRPGSDWEGSAALLTPGPPTPSPPDSRNRKQINTIYYFYILLHLHLSRLLFHCLIGWFYII